MLIVTPEVVRGSMGSGYGLEDGYGYGNGYMNDRFSPGGSGEPPTNPGWDYVDRDTCRFSLVDVIVQTAARRLRC